MRGKGSVTYLGCWCGFWVLDRVEVGERFDLLLTSIGILVILKINTVVINYYGGRIVKRIFLFVIHRLFKKVNGLREGLVVV